MSKTPGKIASVASVQAAQNFLLYLGADWHNNELILVVIAWLTQESGNLLNVIGNNPFNLRPGSDIQKLSNGYRKAGKNGYFATFKTLSLGVEAAAARLLSVKGEGYEEVVAAFRKGDPADALLSLAQSNWDIAHYGYTNNDPTTNHLLKVFAEFTGLQLPPPAPKPRPRSPTQPKLPSNMAFPDTWLNYTSGFQAAMFYKQRHPSAVDARAKR